MLSCIQDFFDSQSSSLALPKLLPSLQQHMKERRPEVHTVDGLRQLITKSQRRAKKILDDRVVAERVRLDMRELEERMANKRMSVARRLRYEKDNAHIITAFNNLKEETLTRLDHAYLNLHHAMQGMRDRVREDRERKKEEQEEAKETHRRDKEDRKRKRSEDKENEKKEKEEKKAKEKEERKERNAQVRMKAAGELIDMKTAEIAKTRQTEEDLQRHRRLEITALRVLESIENQLLGRNVRGQRDEEEQEGQENE